MNATSYPPKLNEPQAEAYSALCAKSKQVGWPRSFATDLTEHDRKRLLHDDPPAIFVWVLRDLGTDLLDARMDAESIDIYFAHYRSDPTGKRWYTYDGTAPGMRGVLREVTIEAAEQFLLKHNNPRGFNRY